MLLERPFCTQVLDIASIGQQLTLGASVNVLLASKFSEAPFVANDDLLATWELVLCAAKGFVDYGFVVVACTDADEDLADVYASDSSGRFT
jgi:hypothetical protein